MGDLPMCHKRRKVAGKQIRPWSDLHGDILGLIKGKLCLIDQLRFRAVCGSWRSVPYVKSADKLPWILGLREAFGGKFLAYYLYDPFNRIEYVLGHQLSRSHNVKVYASKHGWLLASCGSEFFLYHAFTRKTIHLPTLKLKLGRTYSEGTFSAFPTSSDCVFYVLDSWWSQTDTTFMLYTYRNGDITWSKFELRHPYPSRPRHILCSSGGLLYCFCDKFMIWAFDIACGDWRQISIDASLMKFLESDFHTNIWPGYRFKAVESCGELLLVCYHLKLKPWYVFKLDWSQMAWVKQVKLDKQALFIGETSFSVPTEGEIKSLAGRIYFHGDSSPCFYSFNNSARHKSSGFRPLRCEYYYSVLTRLPRQFRWVWIEPHS